MNCDAYLLSPPLDPNLHCLKDIRQAPNQVEVVDSILQGLIHHCHNRLEFLSFEVLKTETYLAYAEPSPSESSLIDQQARFLKSANLPHRLDKGWRLRIRSWFSRVCDINGASTGN